MNFAELMRQGKQNASQAHDKLQQSREADAQAKLKAKEAAECLERERLERVAKLKREQEAAEKEEAARMKERLAEREARKAAEAKVKAEKADPEPAAKKRRTDSAPRPRAVSQLKSARHRSSSPAATDASRTHVVESHKMSPASKLHGKAHIKAEFDPTAIIKLNTAPRDLRSVDEIERDTKASKASKPPTAADFFSQPVAGPSKSASPAPASSVRVEKGPRPAPTVVTVQTQAVLPRAGHAISLTTSAAQVLPSGQLLPPVKRAFSGTPPAPSPAATVVNVKSKTKKKAASPPPTFIPRSESSTSPPVARRPSPTRPVSSPQSPKRVDSRDRPVQHPASPAQKRPRSPSPRAEQEDYRDEIWKMFGRKRSDYAGRNDHSDAESSDMEGGAADLLREEQEAERAARREDQAEERRLAQRKKEKEERKAGRMAKT